MPDDQPEISSASLRLPDELLDDSRRDDHDDLSALDLWFGPEERLDPRPELPPIVAPPELAGTETIAAPAVAPPPPPAAPPPPPPARVPLLSRVPPTIAGVRRATVLQALGVLGAVLIVGLLFRVQVGHVPRPVVSAGPTSTLLPPRRSTSTTVATTTSTTPSTTTSLVPTTLPLVTPTTPLAGTTGSATTRAPVATAATTPRAPAPTTAPVETTVTTPVTEPPTVPTTIASVPDPEPSTTPTTRDRRTTRTTEAPAPDAP
jgi:hypothetical protein